MAAVFRASDWDAYRMDYRDPFRELEPIEREIKVVAQVLSALRDAGIIASVDYEN